MSTIYTDGEYLAKTESWHVEDSPWKAQQILKMLRRNKLAPASIAEIGCGAGVILSELADADELKDARFEGYDISPQAIELASKIDRPNIRFFCQDLLDEGDENHFDLLLQMDVFEHVPDYIGFIEKCRAKADYVMYHIPLEIHVSSVLQKRFMRSRAEVGHLHYFSAETALATLKDTGHEIVDYFYTSAALGLFHKHPGVKKAIANGPRWALSRVSPGMAARLLGGFSLMVLAK